MQVIRVDLENFKSYKWGSVGFAPGTNAICGPNGAGKTTLLEAIGFVLFHYQGPSQEQLVREGEKTATITVHVVDEDGRPYQVVRTCGSYGQCYVYDPEIDQKLTDGVTETAVWLHDFLGVDDRISLSTLFEDAVGVPQGLLTAAFLETPARRKGVFNPLLRVDEYEEVWSALREPIRRLEKEIADEEKRIAGFEAQVEALPEWEEKAIAHRSAIEADGAAAEAAQAEFNDVSVQKVRLEGIKERLDQMERAIMRADAVVGRLEARLHDARKNVEVAEEARTIVAETEAGHQIYLAAQEALQVLEDERHERDRLKDELHKKQTALAQEKQRAEGLQQELARIVDAEEAMAVLAPQVETQDMLEAQLQAAVSRTEHLGEARRRLKEARSRLENLDRRIAEMKAGLEERAETEEQIASLKPVLETLDRKLEALSPQVATRRAGLEQARARAAETKERLAKTEQKLERERARLKAMKSKLVKVNAGLEELTEIEERIEMLRAELGAMDERRETLSSRIAALEMERDQVGQQIRRATKQLSQFEETLREAKEKLATLEAKLSDVKTRLRERAELDQTVVTLRGELETIAAQRNALTSEIATHRAEFDRLGRQMTVLEESEEAECPVCRKPLTPEHRAQLLEQNRMRREELKASLDVLRAQDEEKGETQQQKEKALREAEERVSGLPRPADAEELSARIEAQRKSVVDLEASIAEEREHLSSSRARRQEIDKTLEDVRAQYYEADELKRHHQERLDELENRARELPRPAEAEEMSLQIENAQQATAEFEAAIAEERKKLSSYRAQRDEAAAILDELEAEQEGLERTRTERRERLESLEQQVKSLPRPAELEDIMVQVEEQRALVEKTQSRVAELSDAPNEVERLKTGLDELGDPRRKHHLAADLAKGRESVEEQLAQAEEQVVTLSGEVAALDEQLDVYQDLGERIEIQRSTHDRHKQDHERYVAHIREAETLEERRKKATEQEEALAAAQTERGRLIDQRDEIAAGYDAEAYQELKATHDKLRGEIATLEERLRQTRNQLAEAQAKVEALMKVQAKLGEANAEHNELVKLLSLLKCLRQVIREAGPKVNQALVEVISLQAAQLYADIMADHKARLRWTEDYEITLTSDGRERGFQQLSGGEQMAAALAVRLALLKEISAIDLAFFDEPTANLDDRRRDNLAEQILNVKGFSQLFVISHDDTFEQHTDHVVRVVKEDGRSQTIGE